MRYSIFLALALFITLDFSSKTQLVAQGPQGIRTLLEDTEFQMQFRDELQLDDHQAKQMKEMGDEIKVRLRKMFQENGAKMLSKEDRDAAMESMREDGAKITAETNKKLKEILNEKQMNLYSERTYQMAGGLQGILINPGFSRTLNLTEEQLKKVTEIQKKLTQQTFALFDKLQGATPEERTAIMQQLQALGEKGAKMIEDILDDEQKVKVQKLNDEIPDYVWKAFPKNRNKERPWRPGTNSWKPGQGAPKNLDIPREERPVGGKRQFPGQSDTP